MAKSRHNVADRIVSLYHGTGGEEVRPYRLVLKSLTPAERLIIGEFLSKPAIDAELRPKLEQQIASQPQAYWRLRLPTKKEEKSSRKTWLEIIRGPIGGWQRRGSRVLRKHDPGKSYYRLRLAVIGQMKKPLGTFPFHVQLGKSVKLAVVLEEDYFHWLLLRAVATGEITQLNQCWYCGRIAWRHRRTALFCSDKCRTGYHSALRNAREVRKLPPGLQRRRYQELRRAGKEIGLIDTPRVRQWDPKSR